jgi:glycosyltransferase involved in cell wall biosynthesis
MALALARKHDVWVITRERNLPQILGALERSPMPRLRPIGFDLPRWARWWKRDQFGVRAYYYLWQIGIYFLARRLHAEIGFDVAHHLTFVKYWNPSFVSFLPMPFVWGPVGGGETAPRAFWSSFGARGYLYELARQLGRSLGEHDPFVRLTARNASVAVATTRETEARLRLLGARSILQMSEAALPEEELERMSGYRSRREAPVRFLSIGRLIHWKAFHLALMAFERAALPQSEYWIVGSGPEQGRLERLARSLTVARRVRFCGEQPREKVLETLADCDVLVHPSLHDSGGWVCLEAMAAGRPVICLDVGGPAAQVTPETGITIPADSVAAAVEGVSKAMATLAANPPLRERLGRAGRMHVLQHYRWDRRADEVSEVYVRAMARSAASKARAARSERSDEPSAP